MQISYDPQADAIYIQLIKGEVDNTLQAGKYIHVDVDQNSVPLGSDRAARCGTETLSDL
jgi:uncharacterized protein YuzE